jgi:hypothetical protein
MITSEAIVLTILNAAAPQTIQNAIAALTTGKYTITLTHVQADQIHGKLTSGTGNETKGTVSFTGVETEEARSITLVCPNCFEVWTGRICEHATTVALSVMDSPQATLAALLVSQEQKTRRRKHRDKCQEVKPEILYLSTCPPQWNSPTERVVLPTLREAQEQQHWNYRLAA